MNKFDGRSAVEEYMSSHSLSFSTPDLILKEFVVWLCEHLNDPNDKERVPRIMLYLKGEKGGAGDSISNSGKDSSQSALSKPTGTITDISNKLESKFCIECGSKLKSNSKFCTKCGTKQEEI